MTLASTRGSPVRNRKEWLREEAERKKKKKRRERSRRKYRIRKERERLTRAIEERNEKEINRLLNELIKQEGISKEDGLFQRAMEINLKREGEGG